MIFGEQGELIIQGQTEAGVVAHYLEEVKATELTRSFEPPLPQHRMSWLSFANSRIEDALGTSGKDIHVMSDQATALILTEVLAIAAVPNLPIFKPSRLGRRAFLQKRVNILREGLSKTTTTS